MKKNPHHHNSSNNQQQSQHYFQVMSNPLVGSGPSNYQTNYQQNLVQQQQQQAYFTGMMNKNNGQLNGNTNNNNRNISHRIPHNANSNSHHAHHFNNNNNTNQSTNSNGSGNYPIPQQFNNNNTNYYSNQHQMQYNNNSNSHERRNSYHSGNQHHHHHHPQQQSVLSNLSNQNYSKNFNNSHNNNTNTNSNINNNSNNKPHLQKQISLPENDLSNQLKHTHITSPPPPTTQIQQQLQAPPVNANTKQQSNTDNLDQKPVCNYVNELSPVYENKNADTVDTTSSVNITNTIANSALSISKEASAVGTNTTTNLSTTSDIVRLNELSEETSDVFDDVVVDDECGDGEIVHVIDNDDVYEDEPNSLNDDTTVKPTNLLTSASSSESSLNTNNSTSSSSNTNNSKTLSDLVQKADNYKDKSDYYRHLVYAIDQLYPDCKWPLHSTWTFWFIKHDNNKNWSDNLISVLDVSYVEDFWSGINYLLLNNKSNLINQGDLTFFKKGIKPMWEDEQNKSGGCWLYQVSNQQQYKKINDLWLETLLALIGDNYCDRDLISQVDSTYFQKKYVNNANKLEQDNEHICDFLSGTILMHRGKNDKLSLWTKNYKDDLTTRLIGKIWKNVMKLSETFTINFEAHETKNNKNASNRISYKE